MNILSINCINNTMQNILNKINASGCNNSDGFFNKNYWFSNCMFPFTNLTQVIDSIVGYLSTQCSETILNLTTYNVRLDFNSDKNYGVKGLEYIVNSTSTFTNNIVNASAHRISFLTHIENSTVLITEVRELIKNCDSYTAHTFLFNNENHLIMSVNNKIGTIGNCSITAAAEEPIQFASSSMILIGGIMFSAVGAAIYKLCSYNSQSDDVAYHHQVLEGQDLQIMGNNANMIE